MKFYDVLEDEASRLYVASLPTKQARDIQWRRTQRTPCPIVAWCSSCHQYLPVIDFYPLKTASTHGRKTILKEQRHSICKHCHAQNYQNSNYARRLLYAARKRAKTKGIEFNLTLEDIAIPEYCPALGLRLEPVRGMTGHDASPSLDRIDNSKGYVKGNVTVLSFRANTLKNNATPAELRAIADFIDSCVAANPG